MELPYPRAVSCRPDISSTIHSNRLAFTKPVDCRNDHGSSLLDLLVRHCPAVWFKYGTRPMSLDGFNGLPSVVEMGNAEGLRRWEDDGGGCCNGDAIQLFQGRLYCTRRGLRIAQVRAISKTAGRFIATFIPLVFFMNFSHRG